MQTLDTFLQSELSMRMSAYYVLGYREKLLSSVWTEFGNLQGPEGLKEAGSIAVALKVCESLEPLEFSLISRRIEKVKMLRKRPWKSRREGAGAQTRPRNLVNFAS
jgi:hypothetical protein